MKKLLTKSILLMAGLLVGNSAWADNVNATLEHTAGAKWTTDVSKAAAWADYESTVDAEKEFYNNESSAWSGCAYAKFSFAIPDGHDIVSATLTYSVNQGGSSGRNDIIYYMAKDFDLDWTTFAGQKNVDLRNTANRAGKAVSAAPTGASGDRFNLSQDITTAVKALFDAGQNYILLQWTGNAGSASLYGKGSADHKPTLVITTADASATTSYTVNYLNASDNSVIKTAVVYDDAYVGETADATEGDKATFYSEDGSKKYVYSSNTTTVLVADAASNSINVLFNAYDKVAYTITAKNGVADLKEIASDNAYTDGSTTIYWNKYLKVGDQWYETKNPYGKTITAAGNTDVAYTAADIYDFIECESTSYKSAGDQTNATGASGGVGVLLNSKSAMATTTKIAAGIYDISVYAYVRRSNDDKLKLQYSTDNSTWNDVETLIFESSKAQTQTAEQVILAEDSYIRFLDVATQNSCHYYDYIVIKESTVPVTITDAGWATLYTTAALDFSAVDGLTAYTATLSSDNTVTLTEVDDVPANTGVVLKGSADTYSVPVIAASSTEKGDLKGSTTTSTACTEDGGIYMLSKNGAGDAQFKKATSGSIAAGKAYLQISGGGDASLRVVIEGEEATGIHALNAADTEEGVTYNVAGQRVSGSYKGIVIKNGKKYLRK